MGMPSEEYWHENYKSAYREAYKIRKEERNWELWLQGLYFYHAIAVALNNAFSKGRKLEYMAEPIRIFPMTEEEEAEEEKKKAEALERRLNAFAEAFNRKQNGR